MTPTSTEPYQFPREAPPPGDGNLYPPARPRISLWEALRRRWLIVAATTLVFAGAGVALALARTPTYTAQSRLAVGRLDISAPGAISNFAVATQALAVQYSRIVDARQIVNRVGRQLDMTPLEVTKSISASPIPESPVFRISAKASSEERAVDVATATTRRLVTYTTELNRSNPDSPRLFRRFRRASLVLNRRRAQESRARRALGSNPTSENREALARARTRTETANLQAVTLRNAYSASRQNQSATSLVQILTLPADASSDRGPKLQLYLFIGLMAGLSLGLALALALAQREARRALVG